MTTEMKKDANGLTLDPKKEGIPAFLQTQNRKPSNPAREGELAAGAKGTPGELGEHAARTEAKAKKPTPLNDAFQAEKKARAKARKEKAARIASGEAAKMPLEGKAALALIREGTTPLPKARDAKTAKAVAEAIEAGKLTKVPGKGKAKAKPEPKAASKPAKAAKSKAKASEPKAAKKPTSEAAKGKAKAKPSTRGIQIDDKAVIKVLAEENPKRGQGAKRFALYRSGMSFAKYVEALKGNRSQARADALFDMAREWISITPSPR